MIYTFIGCLFAYDASLFCYGSFIVLLVFFFHALGYFSFKVFFLIFVLFEIISSFTNPKHK